jgi:hypothetical protein
VYAEAVRCALAVSREGTEIPDKTIRTPLFVPYRKRKRPSEDTEPWVVFNLTDIIQEKNTGKCNEPKPKGILAVYRGGDRAAGSAICHRVCG